MATDSLKAAAQASEAAARSWFSWISDAWNGLQQLFGKAASFEQLSTELYSAMFPPGGQGVPQYKASGGPVAANTPYLVGERGPELFQPSVSGRIFNHGETVGMLAGAGGGITINMGGVSLASNMDVDAVGAPGLSISLDARNPSRNSRKCGT